MRQRQKRKRRRRWSTCWVNGQVSRWAAALEALVDADVAEGWGVFCCWEGPDSFAVVLSRGSKWRLEVVGERAAVAAAVSNLREECPEVEFEGGPVG